MKASETLTYTEIGDKIYEADDREAMKKLLLDEVGIRAAWRVIVCMNTFRGFRQDFWEQGGDMSDECRDEMFDELANLFRKES